MPLKSPSQIDSETKKDKGKEHHREMALQSSVISFILSKHC